MPEHFGTDEYYLACVRYIYRNHLRGDDHLVALWDNEKDRLCGRDG
ncbi:MAG: hypothetical protein GXP52_02265 [Deltaproteobacteria bacterium]|nr:hypothetical protein [Deltaproteobacteria bacterium]